MAFAHSILSKFNTPTVAREFWTQSDDRKFATRRFFLFFGVAVFAANGILDILCHCENTMTMLLLRSAACAAMLVIALAFAGRHLRDKGDSLIAAYMAVVIATICTMSLVAKGTVAADVYPLGIVVLFAYTSTLLVPRFASILWISLATLAGWAFVGLNSTSDPLIIWLDTLFILSGIFAACAGCFVRERLEKAHFEGEKNMLELQAKLQKSTEDAIAARDVAIAAQNTQTKFITSVSHELRTPLNAIIGFSDIMRQEIDGPIGNPNYRGYIDDIHRSGKNLLLDINDLLDVHRLKAGKMSWTNERFAIRTAIANAVSTCHHDAAAANIKLVVSEPGLDMDVYADPMRITQAIINLLTNAIKFSHSGGTVSVAQAVLETGGIRISIADKGIGIPAEDLVRVKDPFQQAEDGLLAQQKGGLGLGLSIVSGILEKIGGHLDIESELDVGTTCHIHIPVTALCADQPETAISA